MMAVPVQGGATFVPEDAHELFRGTYGTDLGYPPTTCPATAARSLW